MDMQRVPLLLAMLAVSLLPGLAFAAEPGPKLTEPPGDRLAALKCYGELAASPRPPVLLVHGTIMTPDEAWSWGYQKVLLERGHSVCTVRLPEFGFGDAQRTAEYVATAILEVGRRSGRRLSIVGHSQGGFQPLFALRVWPAAADYVDDFVGLAGAYDRGSERAREQMDPSTRTPASRPFCTDDCVPWLTQQASGSKLLGELGKRDLPAGPSYTAIGTLYDEYITPQPHANQLPRGRPARSIQIQDVCPGRRFGPPSRPSYFPVDHASMLGDAVAHALVLDALDHPGPADPERIPRSVCLKAPYDGLDPVGFARSMATVLPRFAEPQKEVEKEPPLRCNLDPQCADRHSWAIPLLDSARLSPPAIRAARHCPGGCRRPRTALLRVSARAPGWLVLSFKRLGGGRHAARRIGDRLRLSTDEHSIRLRARSCRRRDGRIRCRPLPTGAYGVQLKTKSDDGGYWTRERVLRLQVTRR